MTHWRMTDFRLTRFRLTFSATSITTVVNVCALVCNNNVHKVSTCMHVQNATAYTVRIILQWNTAANGTHRNPQQQQILARTKPVTNKGLT